MAQDSCGLQTIFEALAIEPDSSELLTFRLANASGAG
jgi:hypothetical protein